MKEYNKAIKSGNSKLHKSCGIFNISCIYNCSYCYMKKMKKIYPNISQSWDNNKELSKDEDFIKNVAEVINRRKYKYFRVHAMGEFYDKGYLLDWYKIADLCPDTQFYAYSKNYKVVRYCSFAKPDNFTMVKSVKKIDDVSEAYLPDAKRQGFDSVALVSTNSEAYKKSVVCQAGKHKGNDYCMGKCTRCAQKGKLTILPKH